MGQKKARLGLTRSTLLRGLVLVALYLLLANARSVQPNLLIPGSVMAFYMVIPVIAGLLGGARLGLAVGLLGTLAAAGVFALRGLGSETAGFFSSPAGFELLSVVPHSLMGLCAGWLRNHLPSPIPACALLVGHLLNLLAYSLAGHLDAEGLSSTGFWLGIGWETFIGVAIVTATVAIYRFGLERRPA